MHIAVTGNIGAGKTTLTTMLSKHYGWDELGNMIRINCFISDPSITSSLKFLRKTPWARKKVEDLYISLITKNKL